MADEQTAYALTVGDQNGRTVPAKVEVQAPLTSSLQPLSATMNSSPVNNTSPACPSFVEGVQNLTISYCGLPACANNTAVMSACCNGAEVNSYHHNSNFPGVDASGDAFWCAVANASISIWLDCVAEHGSNNSMALCAGESKSKTNAASVEKRQTQGWTLGMVGLVVLLQGIL